MKSENKKSILGRLTSLPVAYYELIIGLCIVFAFSITVYNYMYIGKATDDPVVLLGIMGVYFLFPLFIRVCQTSVGKNIAACLSAIFAVSIAYVSFA